MQKKLNVLGASALPILSNTIIIVPFMLFIKLSDGATLGSILPFVLFYIFRMTGIFFIRGIRTSMNSYVLLNLSLFCGIIGSICAILGFLNFNFYIISGIFLGLSGAWLPPSNTSVNFYLKKTNQKTKPNLIITLVSFIILGACMVLPKHYSINISFVFYLMLYAFAAFSVRKFVRYKATSHELEEASYKDLFLFAIYFILLFFLRSSRLLFDAAEFEYFTLGLFLLTLVFMVYILFFKNRISLKLPLSLSTLTIINGAVGNYLFLFSSLYATAVFGANSLLLKVYLPYVLGMLIGPVLKNKNKFVALAGVSGGLLIVLFTNFFSFGILCISVFKNNLNSWLTQEYFNSSYLPDDKRIWIKYSLQNIGSITHQFILMIIASLILKIDNLPIKVFFTLTSKTNTSSANQDIMIAWNHIATSLILLLIIVYCVFSYVDLYRKKK